MLIWVDLTAVAVVPTVTFTSVLLVGAVGRWVLDLFPFGRYVPGAPRYYNLLLVTLLLIVPASPAVTGHEFGWLLVDLPALRTDSTVDSAPRRLRLLFRTALALYGVPGIR